MTSHNTPAAASAELVRAAARAFNAGNTDECLAFIAPDFIINLAELPEPRHGREAWRQNFETMKRAFPDVQAHIEGHRRRRGQGRRPAAAPRHPWICPDTATLLRQLSWTRSSAGGGASGGNRGR